MSELLERELSRVLHNLPGEPAVQPTLYADVQQRARRIRRQRYGGTALAAAAAVIIAAVVPSVFFGHGTRAAPPANEPVTTWPTRGALGHDIALRQAAVTTWQHALTAAPRGRLSEPPAVLYADHTPGVGVVVVLAGPEPRGGDRVVVVRGSDAQHLSLYADQKSFD